MELNPAPDDDAVRRGYARWLRRGTWLGVVVLVAGFAAYLFGATPHVPIEQLPALWDRPAATYLEQTGLRPGWHWASLVHRSDMLVLAGVALLASCSIASLVAAIGSFHHGGERVFVAICILQIAVLVLAASGLLTVGP
ncbi:MAG: DUF1634 domain-containing protein [Pseudomonadota bacterium]|nr:DUF1634 domain-containing protein [Pseudomonadota bacterium]